MPSSAALICRRRSAISSARSRSRASTLSLSIVAKRSSLRLSVGCAAVGVAVVSDTTGYLPRELVAANRIHLVSLYVVFGGERTEREADITDYAAFFEELRSVEQLPTTSQPSVGDFIATYPPAVGGRLLRPLRATARRRRRRGVGAHLRRAVGHARVGAPGVRAAR